MIRVLIDPPSKFASPDVLRAYITELKRLQRKHGEKQRDIRQALDHAYLMLKFRMGLE